MQAISVFTAAPAAYHPDMQFASSLPDNPCLASLRVPYGEREPECSFLLFAIQEPVQKQSILLTRPHASLLT